MLENSEFIVNCAVDCEWMIFLIALKGLCHTTRMREPMKTNLKKTAQLFQVVSEILEGCFYLSKSQPSFDS